MSVTIQTSILKRIRATLQPTPLTAALRNSEKTTKETKEETNGRTSEQTIKETDEKAYEGPSEEELSWFAEDSNSEGERGYKAYVDERDRMGNEFKGFEAYMQDQPNLKWNKNVNHRFTDAVTSVKTNNQEIRLTQMSLTTRKPT